MFAPDDTIVAIATPPGRGGIGIVRISGPGSLDVAAAILTNPRQLEPRRATFTHVRSAGGTVDDVIATAFIAPHSYTGQDVVEISAHGSPVVLRAIVAAAIDAGARLAHPGEFTLRAFLSGRIDLIQAEAVADLIAAATPLQARVAFDQLEGTLTSRIAALDAELFDLMARLEASLDFPEEGYHFIEPREIAERIGAIVEQLDCLLRDADRGRLIREGATVAIVGRPNVGKSSLFNALAGVDRAIVTEIPGTTRDLITEAVEIEGIPVTLVDTAGMRHAIDVVEREGVARATRAQDAADLLLLVIDQSETLTANDQRLLEQTSSLRRIVVANKCDVASVHVDAAVRVSAKTGEGLADLRRAIGQALSQDEITRDTPLISNLRHVTLLRQARESLGRARESSSSETPEEFLLSDLQSARARFDEVVGVRTSDDLLRHIFERFCIGK